MVQNANFDRLMQAQMDEIKNGTPLLLHACCAPCSSAVLERLSAKFDVTVLYYNPNIRPLAEYTRRAGEFDKLLERGFRFRFVEGNYDAAAFSQAAKGLEGEPEGGPRCGACFALRLCETAHKAAALGIEWFATTLSVSPHKNAAALNLAGEAAAMATGGVRYLPADFKKRGGYARSVELSRELGLYRQEYCGCMLPSAGEAAIVPAAE